MGTYGKKYKEWWDKNKDSEKLKKRRKAYYEANRIRLLEYQKSYNKNRRKRKAGKLVQTVKELEALMTSAKEITWLEKRLEHRTLHLRKLRGQKKPKH